MKTMKVSVVLMAAATAIFVMGATLHATNHGKAKNSAEMSLVTKLVNDINGVKSVRNRMTLE